MAVLVIRLFNLQFVHGDDNLKKEQDFSRKEIRITGPRGEILDRNGLPLAYNETSYSVEFVRDPSLVSTPDRYSYTKSILKTIEIIDKNGGKFLSTFAIRKMDDGTYDFYWPGIDKSQDPKTYNNRVLSWKSLNCSSARKIYSKDSPEQIFMESRAYYGIPDNVSYEEAFEALSVWQEARSSYYSSYLPITLASNVDAATVAEIEIHSNELIGMQITQSQSRVYPNKTMAAHIIGYMGRMVDEPQIKSMEQLGYQQDDLVGLSGIESSEETELSGDTSDRTGTRVVEVNNLGKVVQEISTDNKSAKAGNNVMLTIDSGMQKELESALAQNIAQTKSAQETAYQAGKDGPYGYDAAVAQRGGWDKAPIQYASVGAAVVMNVQTGEILAMASYPSFDPNLFTQGISSDDYLKYFGPGTNNPLFDNAISSRGTPGSIFKMCTGLAGLMDGALTLTEQISDGGYYNVHIPLGSTEHGPKCWAFGNSTAMAQHQNQTIVQGLQNSCDYFFYTVADRLGIDKLDNWADQLGLTSKTGVELPSEISGQVASQASLYSSTYMSGTAALVRNQIITLMSKACKSAGLSYDSDQFNKAALDLMDLVNQNLNAYGPDIRAILQNELKLTPAQIASNNSLDLQISMLLAQITWSLNPNYTVEAGIGQSTTLLTPIGVARYVSAIVNGGNVYEARLVKEIITPDGQVRPSQPKLVRNIAAPQADLNALMAGMQKVVSDEEGTAAKYFKNYKYLSRIGGKTGTAQVNASIDLENNSWFVAFAPYQPNKTDSTAEPDEKPEIVVVVYIPHGYEGALSSYTAQQIITYYLDGKSMTDTPGPMPQANTLVQ
jgi:penicillin-binding protein 2